MPKENAARFSPSGIFAAGIQKEASSRFGGMFLSSGTSFFVA